MGDGREEMVVGRRVREGEIKASGGRGVYNRVEKGRKGRDTTTGCGVARGNNKVGRFECDVVGASRRKSIGQEGRESGE